MKVEEALETLLSNGYVDMFWTNSDIRYQANEDGYDLSDEQVEEVRLSLSDVDANVGISWETISATFHNLFGSPKLIKHKPS